MERDRKIELVVEIAGLGLLAIATLGAFSKPVRQKIWKRDGGRCVICGSTDQLNCGHIDHSKSNPRYDHESNGRLICEPDHYLIDHVNREGRNGLSLNHNKFAKRSLWARLTDAQKKKLPPPD